MSDLGVVATLLAITTIEGFRWLPADSVVLQRLGAGDWNVAREKTRAGMHLISWCIPVLAPVVLSPQQPGTGATGVRRLLHRFHARSRRTRLGLACVRAASFVTLATVVLVLPAATQRFGGTGLAASGAAVLLLCVLQAWCTYLLLRRSGAPGKRALVASLGVLNPFASHRAGEIVQAQIASGMPTLAAAFALLGEDRFMLQLRRTAYDALHDDEHADARAVLTQLIEPERLARHFATSPECAVATMFCPRCAAAFIVHRADCTECVVPLLPCPVAPTR